jgi:hypothetical protein
MTKKLFTLALALIGINLIAQTPRMVLYEEFTGETCPPCAATNPGLNALLSSPTNTPKIIPIKWQVPIPSAPTNTWSLYQTNKTEIDYRWQSGNGSYGYNPAINSAPSSKIDGQEATFFGANSGHPADLTNGVIATAQSYTSAFSISVNRAWDATCSSVNLTISIVASANFTSTGALKLRTVMVERLIQFSVQPGTNGETTFEDAAIKSFPSIQAGTPMASTWLTGQTQTFTLNCPLPSYVRNKNQVAFVCFIQDDGTKKVAQAVRADKAPIPSEALAALDAKVKVTCTNSISPQITIRNDGLQAITTLTVHPFTDGTAGNTTAWTGNLAAGSSTTILLNSITTSTTNGVHTFSFSVDINVPSYNLTYSANKVSYLVASNYQGTSVAENFALANFPPANWTNSNSNSGPAWTRAVNAGAHNIAPLASAKYDFFNNSKVGDVDELYLPPSNLTGTTVPSLSFVYAYAQRNANSNDKLDVLVSDDCGANWSNVYSNAGSMLATAPPVASAYVPDLNDETQWRTEVINLTAFAKPQVLVKFVVTNDNGNNIYIDDVNLTQSTSVGLVNQNKNNIGFDVFPNPTNGEVTLKLNAANSGKTFISVLNTLGQVVFEKHVNMLSGINTIQIDTKDFAVGVYNITVMSNNSTSIKKLTVIK